MRLLSVAVVAFVALAGCSDVSSLLGDEGVQDTLDVTASISARFTPEANGFEVIAGDILPEGVSAEVEGPGGVQPLAADALAGVGTSRLTFESPVAFKDGEQYTVRLLYKGVAVTDRTFTFHDQDLLAPQSDVRATYSVSFSETDGSFDMGITGTATVEMSGDDLRLSMSGTGSATMKDDELEMQLTIEDFQVTDVNERTTAGLMSATGTWSMDSDGVTGSGTIDTMEMTFLGAEAHLDADGVSRDADKERMFLQMDGVVNADGVQFQMAVETDEASWTDAEDGTPFWRKGYEESTITYEGESSTDRTDFDEAVEAEDDAEPSLSDMLPDDGPFLWPLAPGDSFVHEGSEVRIDFQVRRGGARDLQGGPVGSWVLQGDAIAGAEGSEHMVIVADGPYAGLPIEYEQDYTRGDLATSMELEFVRVR